MTRNYLSQIFKLETGENYNNYLTRVRMDKAKELILKGNYKLYEIARMVGYKKNTAYFSQLFKKNTQAAILQKSISEVSIEVLLIIIIDFSYFITIHCHL